MKGQGKGVLEIYTDADTGYRCMIWMNPVYATLYGYIEVSVYHPHIAPYFKDNTIMDICDSPIDDYDVHGGVTFARRVVSPDSDYPLSSDGCLWVGFDCVHSGDDHWCNLKRKWWSELIDTSHLPFPLTYKDLPFVRGEINKLAKQLRSAESKHLPPTIPMTRNQRLAQNLETQMQRFDNHQPDADMWDGAITLIGKMATQIDKLNRRVEKLEHKLRTQSVHDNTG